MPVAIGLIPRFGPDLIQRDASKVCSRQAWQLFVSLFVFVFYTSFDHEVSEAPFSAAGQRECICMHGMGVFIHKTENVSSEAKLYGE